MAVPYGTSVTQDIRTPHATGRASRQKLERYERTPVEFVATGMRKREYASEKSITAKPEYVLMTIEAALATASPQKRGMDHLCMRSSSTSIMTVDITIDAPIQ